MTQIAITIAIFLVAATVMIILLSKQKPKRGTHTYKQVPVMTNVEMRLFQRLVQELPEYYIFPQVSMGALLKPTATNEPQRLVAFRAISQKRVDFVICNQGLETVCLLELDDSTHRPEKDKARDQVTHHAGYQTIRLRGNPATLSLTPLLSALGLS